MIGSVGTNTCGLASVFSSISASQRHAQMFKKLDTNGDGKIDAAELQAGAPKDGKSKDAATIMKEVDTSGDGSIDSTENDAFLTKMEAQGNPGVPPPGPKPSGGPQGRPADSSSQDVSAIFDKLDTNKDGVVSLQELMAATGDDGTTSDLNDLFTSIDSNSDGSVTKDELSTFLAKLEEEVATPAKLTQSYNGQGMGTASGIGQSVDTAW
jgi:Ca2+-binding EF-hand superfamily protein